MNLHFVGDSHVCVFSGKTGMVGYYPKYIHQSLFNTNWWVYHTGPHLAFNFVKYGLPVVGGIIENYLKKDDLVCLVWGEIDCRVWIVARALLKIPNPDGKFKHIEFEKARTKLHSIEEIELEAKVCAETYLRGVDEIGMPNNVIIIGPPPCLWEYLESFVKVYPSVGTEIEQNVATKIFNEELQKGAKKRDMRFFSLFDRLSPANEHRDFYSDNIHLSVKALPLYDEGFKSIGVNCES